MTKIINLLNKDEHLQDALAHLTLYCLTDPFRVNQFLIIGDTGNLRIEYGSGFQKLVLYVGPIEMIKHLVELVQLVSGKPIENGPSLQLIPQAQRERVQNYPTEHGRVKAALQILGRSQKDFRVISKCSLEDLSTAYAFYLEAPRSEQLYIFDAALQTA